MNELLVAVVRKGHVDGVLEALVAAGHRVTGLSSFGGFLREDSRTLFLAVNESDRQAVIDIFARECAGADVEVPLFVSERLSDWRDQTVHHAGATIFVLPLTALVRT
jgi:uncharacterized protein YaaQ